MVDVEITIYYNYKELFILQKLRREEYHLKRALESRVG